MAKKIKKEENKEEKSRHYTKKERNARQELYRYHKRKRAAWAEFIKTPEGIEAIKKRNTARQIAWVALKKRGYSAKDLDPLKWFASK